MDDFYVNFSVRAANCIHNAGIKNRRELLKRWNKDQFSNVRNAGNVVKEEIASYLGVAEVPSSHFV